LEAIKPVSVIISSHKDNEYGYRGVDILQTDVLGNLIIETDGEKLGIRKFE